MLLGLRTHRTPPRHQARTCNSRTLDRKGHAMISGTVAEWVCALLLFLILLSDLGILHR